MRDDRLDIVTRKIARVEGENLADALDVHRRHQPCVVNLASQDAVAHHEAFPLAIDRREVRKDRQEPLDLSRSASTAEEPRPLFAIGRVAAFQNSAMF
jgi:hypothetical protein